MIAKHPRGIILFAVLAGILLLFSCMDEDDQRKSTVDQFGEPDEIETGGYGANQYQIYYYDRADLNMAYIYQKSAPGCGSQGNWYVIDLVYPADLYYNRETYSPPKMVHTPVKTAPPGAAISIRAKVTDDYYVKEVILYCRTVGEAEFLPVTMAPGDSSVFFAEIPASKVNTAGVEYYIEGSDSGHTSRLPYVKGLYLVSVSPGSAITYGTQETSPKSPKPVSVSLPGKRSPVGP